MQKQQSRQSQKSQQKPTVILQLIRSIPVVGVLALITLFVVRNGATTINTIVEQFNDRNWLTTLAFMGLFLLKSVSFGLPFALLYVGVGSIYPLGWAIVVNLLGIAVNMQIPYIIGRYAGRGYVERLLGKFPSLGKLEALSQQSSLLFSFMVKFVGKIPHEITNALLGSLKVPYAPYMIGGILGLLPTMIATTLVGSYLDEPGSPVFMVSVALVLVLMGVSFGLYRKYR